VSETVCEILFHSVTDSGVHGITICPPVFSSPS